MKMRSTVPMLVAKAGYIVMSAVFCLAGLMFMIWPDISKVSLGYLLGAYMIVFGIIKIIGYFSKDLFRLAFQYDLEFGIILMVLGMIIFARAPDAINYIFIAAGIAILADSLFKIRIAQDAKSFGIHSWRVILILAALTCLLGSLLSMFPWKSTKLLTILTGASLFSEGLLHLCVALSTVKIIKNQYPDIIDTDYSETEAVNK